MTVDELVKLSKRKQIDPGMINADQMIANTVKMRGLGPDDPIEWDAFGTSPRPMGGGGGGFLSKLFGPQVAQAMTTAGGDKEKEGMISQIITEMLGLGMSNGVQVPANWRRK